MKKYGGVILIAILSLLLCGAIFTIYTLTSVPEAPVSDKPDVLTETSDPTPLPESTQTPEPTEQPESADTMEPQSQTLAEPQEVSLDELLGIATPAPEEQTAPQEDTKPITRKDIDSNDMQTIDRMLMEMEPSRADIKKQVLKHIPELYKDEDFFQVDVLTADRDVFTLFIQLDIGAGNIELCKAVAAEIVSEIKGINYEVIRTDFMFVNNGAPVCQIDKNADQSDFTIFIDGKMERFTVD